MQITTLRSIDFFIAKPIAVIVSCFFFILRPFRRDRQIEKAKIRSIVVCKFYGIGSHLYLASMVKSLRAVFPNARIGLLTLKSNAAVLTHFDIFDDFYSLDDASLIRLLKSTLLAYFSVWRARVQIAIDAEFFTNISLLAILFTFARYRVGFYLNNFQRTNILTHFALYNQHKHISRVFQDLAVVLGASEVSFSYPVLRIPSASRERVHAIYNELNSGETRKVICVNVNASDLAIQRRWPIEYFQELCTKILSAKNDAYIFLIGSTSEREYTEQARGKTHPSDLSRVRNIAGEIELIDLFELLRRADIFIGNDSGPVHIAAAMGTRTISLFGPETPSLYGPVGEQHKIFYDNTYCSPCINVYNMKTSQAGHKRCRHDDNLCLKSISPSEVVEEVLKLWEE